MCGFRFVVCVGVGVVFGCVFVFVWGLVLGGGYVCLGFFGDVLVFGLGWGGADLGALGLPVRNLAKFDCCPCFFF